MDLETEFKLANQKISEQQMKLEECRYTVQYLIEERADDAKQMSRLEELVVEASLILNAQNPASPETANWRSTLEQYEDVYGVI